MSLPSEVTGFLRERISSLSQLELLLLLHGDTRRVWTATSASSALHLTESWVATQLELFVDDGFARRDDDTPRRYRWQLSDPRLAATIDRVASAYQGRRTRVIESIYSAGSAAARATAGR